MKKSFSKNVGLQELYKKYQKAFRIPENLNHYSGKDFRNAERSFIRYGISNGNMEASDRSSSTTSLRTTNIIYQ
jgi:hypothetical protein